MSRWDLASLSFLFAVIISVYFRIVLFSILLVLHLLFFYRIDSTCYNRPQSMVLWLQHGGSLVINAFLFIEATPSRIWSFLKEAFIIISKIQLRKNALKHFHRGFLLAARSFSSLLLNRYGRSFWRSGPQMTSGNHVARSSSNFFSRTGNYNEYVYCQNHKTRAAGIYIRALQKAVCFLFVTGTSFLRISAWTYAWHERNETFESNADVKRETCIFSAVTPFFHLYRLPSGRSINSNKGTQRILFDSWSEIYFS